jgi:hypothetical protein
MDIEDSINAAENALRDLVEALLRMKHGDSWFDKLGLTRHRVSTWTERREEEQKRRPGGEVEERLLYYSEFHDVVEIVLKNWDGGFKDCFLNKKRFEVYTERLSTFRNPDAHSRSLFPFEEQLVLGMTGELRQDITLFLSRGGGGPEPEHFARIESVSDSFGGRAVGTSTSAVGGIHSSSVVLREGDVVSFKGSAWDPEGGELEWQVALMHRIPTIVDIDFSGDEMRWDWRIETRDIGENVALMFIVVSPRPYRRKGVGDDTAQFHYRVLPRRS